MWQVKYSETLVNGEKFWQDDGEDILMAVRAAGRRVSENEIGETEEFTGGSARSQDGFK